MIKRVCACHENTCKRVHSYSQGTSVFVSEKKCNRDPCLSLCGFAHPTDSSYAILASGVFFSAIQRRDVIFLRKHGQTDWRVFYSVDLPILLGRLQTLATKVGGFGDQPSVLLKEPEDLADIDLLSVCSKDSF